MYLESVTLQIIKLCTATHFYNVFNPQYTGLLLLLFKILIDREECEIIKYLILSTHMVVLWHLEKYVQLYTVDGGSQTVCLNVPLYVFRNHGLPIPRLKILIIWVHVQGVTQSMLLTSG